MLFSVEQAFVVREEIRAPLKTLAWEASLDAAEVEKYITKMFPPHMKLEKACYIKFSTGY